MIHIDAKHFKLLQEKIYELSGIAIVDSKFAMAKNRVLKLTKDTHCESVESLLAKVAKDKNIEQAFINVFTTNKTDFFRESFHFDDLLDRVLPQLFKTQSRIKIYCCASSTGQEPYSIAATVVYAKKIYNASTQVEIIATDIDTQVLEVAKEGKYTINPLMEKWPKWAESEILEFFDVVDESKKMRHLCVKPKLKNMITFKQLNLFAKRYPFSNEEFDIVFCRNILIYFTKPDQENILQRLFSLLKVGGTFYLGHSESLYDLANDTEKLGHKIFIRQR